MCLCVCVCGGGGGGVGGISSGYFFMQLGVVFQFFI